MKKPYLTQEERRQISLGTQEGNGLKLYVSCKKIERQQYEMFWVFGYITSKIIIRLKFGKYPVVYFPIATAYK